MAQTRERSIAEARKAVRKTAWWVRRAGVIAVIATVAVKDLLLSLIAVAVTPSADGAVVGAA